jgi:CheY-like chemotaxis protein
MSVEFPPEQVVHLHNDLQLLVDQTGSHQEEAETLVALAERDLQEAQTFASDAINADVDELREAVRRHVQRRIAGAAKARELCVSARAQHGAACRMLAAVDGHDCGAPFCGNAVLVVDDFSEVRDLIKRVLQNAGFVVRTAANGLEGLIAAYEMRPDVIVMDVTMPVLDGIEATRLIKATEATRAARVIAYTGNALADTSLSPTLFSAVLHKPATTDAVLATVQHVARLQTS